MTCRYGQNQNILICPDGTFQRDANGVFSQRISGGQQLGGLGAAPAPGSNAGPAQLSQSSGVCRYGDSSESTLVCPDGFFRRNSQGVFVKESDSIPAGQGAAPGVLASSGAPLSSSGLPQGVLNPSTGAPGSHGTVDPGAQGPSGRPLDDGRPSAIPADPANGQRKNPLPTTTAANAFFRFTQPNHNPGGNKGDCSGTGVNLDGVDLSALGASSVPEGWCPSLTASHCVKDFAHEADRRTLLNGAESTSCVSDKFIARKGLLDTSIKGMGRTEAFVFTPKDAEVDLAVLFLPCSNQVKRFDMSTAISPRAMTTYSPMTGGGRVSLSRSHTRSRGAGINRQVYTTANENGTTWTFQGGGSLIPGDSGTPAFVSNQGQTQLGGIFVGKDSGDMTSGARVTAGLSFAPASPGSPAVANLRRDVTSGLQGMSCNSGSSTERVESALAGDFKPSATSPTPEKLMEEKGDAGAFETYNAKLAEARTLHESAAAKAKKQAVARLLAETNKDEPDPEAIAKVITNLVRERLSAPGYGDEGTTKWPEIVGEGFVDPESGEDVPESQRKMAEHFSAMQVDVARRLVQDVASELQPHNPKLAAAVRKVWSSDPVQGAYRQMFAESRELGTPVCVTCGELGLQSEKGDPFFEEPFENALDTAVAEALRPTPAHSPEVAETKETPARTPAQTGPVQLTAGICGFCMQASAGYRNTIQPILDRLRRTPGVQLSISDHGQRGFFSLSEGNTALVPMQHISSFNAGSAVNRALQSLSARTASTTTPPAKRGKVKRINFVSLFFEEQVGDKRKYSGSACGITPFVKAPIPGQPGKCRMGLATAAHCVTRKKDGEVQEMERIKIDSKGIELSTPELQVFVPGNFSYPERVRNTNTRTAIRNDIAAVAFTAACSKFPDDEIATLASAPNVPVGRQVEVGIDRELEISDHKPEYRRNGARGSLLPRGVDTLSAVRVTTDPYNQTNLIQGGDSGGPLTNERGELFAFVSSSYKIYDPSRVTAETKVDKERSRKYVERDPVNKLPIAGGGPQGEGIYVLYSPGAPGWLRSLQSSITQPPLLARK